MKFAPVVALTFAAFSLASSNDTELSAHVAQGMEAFQQGRYLQAETSFRLALSLAATLPGDDPRLARAHNNLAAVYHVQGRYADAQGEYRLALDWWRSHASVADPDESKLLNNLASTLRATGHFEEARNLAQQAVETAARHRLPAEQANAAFTLGEILRASGDQEGAAQSLTQAVTLARQSLGERSLLEAHIRQSLAMLSLNVGDVAVAREHIVAAYPIFENKLDPAHPDLATAASNLAQVLVADHRDADALGPLQTALHIWQTRLGPNHPRVAIALNNLGQWQLRQGLTADAETSLRSAIAIWEQSLGANHPDTARAYLNLGVLFQSQGKWHGAESLFERALKTAEQTLGPAHRLTRDARELLAGLYDHQKRPAKAKRLRQSASLQR
ncbi:MAG TPA: tetratricopeptide repeat protein [Bryobacteraceae bacterium]|nr:tetratricopeptide repeat protein [Bryobacteraceae bacterium]